MFSVQPVQVLMTHLLTLSTTRTTPNYQFNTVLNLTSRRRSLSDSPDVFIPILPSPSTHSYTNIHTPRPNLGISGYPLTGDSYTLISLPSRFVGQYGAYVRGSHWNACHFHVFILISPETVIQLNEFQGLSHRCRRTGWKQHWECGWIWDTFDKSLFPHQLLLTSLAKPAKHGLSD